ncbi:MAG: sirohydrochlorin cobaltochelatase [Syntrophobacteraceae bacterium]
MNGTEQEHHGGNSMKCRWKNLWLWSLGLCLLFFCGQAVAAGHGDKRETRKAILLAAFGTSVPEAQEALAGIEGRVRKEFPGMEVRWAYTSRMIRAKLAKEGKRLDSPETAMARLMDDGYTHVAVLSLQTIPGIEFHELTRNAHLFEQMSGGFRKVIVARPLLSSHDDMERAAKAMLKHLPAGRKAEDAVLLMGHGSAKHPADGLYLAMNQVFRELDPNVFMGTVEGFPTLDDLLPKLKEKKSKKVYLIPFMAVAGDHARNDMAGDEPDSWKSVLKKNGFASEAVLKGTIENSEVVGIWLDHLKAALAHFER